MTTTEVEAAGLEHCWQSSAFDFESHQRAPGCQTATCRRPHFEMEGNHAMPVGCSWPQKDEYPTFCTGIVRSGLRSAWMNSKWRQLNYSTDAQLQIYCWELEHIGSSTLENHPMMVSHIQAMMKMSPG